MLLLARLATAGRRIFPAAVNRLIAITMRITVAVTMVADDEAAKLLRVG